MKLYNNSTFCNLDYFTQVYYKAVYGSSKNGSFHCIYLHER